jgi:hypothetical protein
VENKSTLENSKPFVSTDLTVSHSTFKISGCIPSQSISGHPDNTIYIKAEELQKRVTGVAEINMNIRHEKLYENAGRINFKLRVTESEPNGKSEFSIRLMYGDKLLDKIDGINNTERLMDLELNAYVDDFTTSIDFDVNLLRVEINAETESLGELAFGSGEIILSKMNAQEVLDEKI